LNAEIIAIGSELLTPYRQDTNSLFLTERLNRLGVEVIFKTVMGDSREHLASAARIALGRVDIVICMGGLGPTEDDVTREAVADALGVALKRDPDFLARLYARFTARRMKMPENNARQADVVAGGVILPNPRGTAPGQWIETEFEGRPKVVMLLPGPPHELEPLFDEQCMERLRAKVPQQFIATRVLKVAMMPESQCDARIVKIYKKFTDVQTTILASAGDIELHLRARGASLEKARARVDELADALEGELDDFVYSSKGETLEQIVGYYLQMRNATLAVAESCTGGLVAQRITSVSGSSRYFVGGAVAYSNELKTRLAEVPAAVIAEHGAVSKQVAIAMAEGIRKICAATIGASVTGVAGPTGGTPEKPVGLVFHAVSNSRTTDVVERRFPGDRERIRLWASQQTLDMVRRMLMRN
jgi:nicotinamide-nucleotide amidase